MPFVRRVRSKLIFNVDLDESGNPELLRFPPFHQELLTQDWWNASENLGRIRVIISEGLFNAKITPPLKRLKNIVTFSFQHAPLGNQLLQPQMKYGRS